MWDCNFDNQGVKTPTRVLPSNFSVTHQSLGLPGSLGKLMCEVTPASGQERFVWRHLNNGSRSSPGPGLEIQETRFLAEPWQCQLFQGQKLLGAAVHIAESSPGRRLQNAVTPTPKPSPWSSPSPVPPPTSSPSQSVT